MNSINAEESFNILRLNDRNDCYSKSNVDNLFASASDYISSQWLEPFDRVFRCKLKSYWDNIMTNNNGIMEVYVKDGSGHPRSPINGDRPIKLKGKHERLHLKRFFKSRGLPSLLRTLISREKPESENCFSGV